MHRHNRKPVTYIRKVVGDVKREYKKSLELSRQTITLLNQLPVELQLQVLDNYNTPELIDVCQRYGNLMHICKDLTLWVSRVKKDFNLMISDELEDVFADVQYLYSPLYDGELYFDILVLPQNEDTTLNMSQLFNIVLDVEHELDSILRQISDNNIYITNKKSGRLYYSNIFLLPDVSSTNLGLPNKHIGYMLHLIPKVDNVTMMGLVEYIVQTLQEYQQFKKYDISVNTRQNTDIPTNWNNPIADEWIHSVYDDEDQQEDEDDDNNGGIRPDPEFPYTIIYEFVDGSSSRIGYSYIDNEDDNLFA